VNHVKLQPAQPGGRCEHAQNAPALRDGHGTTAGAGQLNGGQQDGFQVDRTQLRGKSAGIVGHAVAGGIEVSADQPDPDRHSHQ
jgi:hypothetical protein